MSTLLFNISTYSNFLCLLNPVYRIVTCSLFCVSFYYLFYELFLTLLFSIYIIAIICVYIKPSRFTKLYLALYFVSLFIISVHTNQRMCNLLNQNYSFYAFQQAPVEHYREELCMLTLLSNVRCCLVLCMFGKWDIESVFLWTGHARPYQAIQGKHQILSKVIIVFLSPPTKWFSASRNIT